MTSSPASAVSTTSAMPAPKIALDAPLAEPLSRGVVFINHRVEHLLLAPAFGPKALEVSPAIGHLHITLDGAT